MIRNALLSLAALPFWALGGLLFWTGMTIGVLADEIKSWKRQGSQP